MNPLFLKIGVGIGVGVIASFVTLVTLLCLNRGDENRARRAQRHSTRNWSGASQLGGACCICYDEMCNGKKLFALPCEHKMHLYCLKEMLKVVTAKRCPMCRESIDSSVVELIRVTI